MIRSDYHRRHTGGKKKKHWIKTPGVWREESRILPKFPHQTTVAEVV